MYAAPLIETGRLCTVLGHTTTGRIVSVEIAPDWIDDQPIRLVRVELSTGIVEVPAGMVTQTMTAADMRFDGGRRVGKILGQPVRTFLDDERYEE